MATGTPGGKVPGTPRTGFGLKRFRVRFVFYIAILVALLVFRIGPMLRARFAAFHPAETRPAKTVILAGLALAPALIPRLASTYREMYPALDIRIHEGGCKYALQEIANNQADVAFLDRRPTAEEQKLIHAVADSAESWPIALGGIAVLSGAQAGFDSISVKDLRAWILGGSTAAPRPRRIYCPDPNSGLWESIALCLKLPAGATSALTWMPTEAEIAHRVATEAGSLGFSSTFSLPPDLDRIGARIVPVRGDTASCAAMPIAVAVANGDYPLYHYLFLSYLPSISPAASGFVTFLYSPSGQRLVEREGFLPARETARVIQLIQKPVG